MTTNATPVVYNRSNPCTFRLRSCHHLSEEGSAKDTRHYEFDLCGTGLSFEPGDSLALFSSNCPELVSDILTALGFSGDEEVVGPNKETTSIGEALLNQCAITAADKKLLNAICEKAVDDPAAAELKNLLAPEMKQALADHLWGLEIIDFLLQFPQAKFEPQEFVSVLRKLTVRLYSIASSLAHSPDQVDLTVASVRYHSHGRDRKGVCSTWLADRLETETEVRGFISPGKGFRLSDPEDDTPIIMIGPGTGIAPFRAFLQHRQATNAKGKAWLFFGEQHEATEFFYREEFDDALSCGLLDRLTTAFSRDQDYKIYVQHRLKECGADVWQWLEDGAIFYVCGDAARMAGDVDQALHEIVAEHGDRSQQDAAAYIENLRSEKRYRRDVY
jgi:sulfite reductase (NADPH) flavoprotein alpha-component